MARLMTHRERQAGVGRWPTFQPNKEVRCPDCDWFMQWGDGSEDRTSYFRQSHYEPCWKHFYQWEKECQEDRNPMIRIKYQTSVPCPRCKKVGLAYKEIVDERREERVNRVVEFTDTDGSECVGKITDVVIGYCGRFTSREITGLIVGKVHHKGIEA